MNKNSAQKRIKFWEDLSIETCEAFEKYVASNFFPEYLYEILEKTPDFRTKLDRFIRSSLNPYYRFEIKNANIQFWVECKFRGNSQNSNLISVFKPEQLSRYQTYQNSFLFLCTYKYKREYQFLVPINDIKGDSLYLSFLEPYKLNFNFPVKPELLMKYIS